MSFAPANRWFVKVGNYTGLVCRNSQLRSADGHHNWRSLTALLSGSFIAMALLLFPTPSLGQQSKSNQQQVAAGKSIVKRNCATCHAVAPGRASPHPQAPSFTQLSKSYPVAALAESLAEGIMTGHPDMPVFEFSASDVDDIIVYLESIQIQ